jgi:hypothetical protein
MLFKKKLKAEVDKLLDYVCNNIMPSTVRQECVAFVNQYGPAVIQFLLSEINPNKICVQIKVCSSSNVIAPLNIINSVHSDVECSVCIFVATAVEGLVKQNKTEEEIKYLAEKICNIFSGSLQAQVCLNFPFKVNNRNKLILFLVPFIY